MLNQSFLDNWEHRDINGDNISEIIKMKLLPFEEDDITIPDSARVLLVMVENRLLNDAVATPSPAVLLEKLERLREDLWCEGYFPRFISADIYDGANHQDGRSLLALRGFFQGVYNRVDHFSGALLIGSFPEAMIVRRWVWKTSADYSFETETGKTVQGETLRIVPEIVCGRSDIVLEDLDGGWDGLYCQERTLESVEMRPCWPFSNMPWPVMGQPIQATDFKVTTLEFKDFFYIRDDRYTIDQKTEHRLNMRVFETRRNPEVSSTDRNAPNPIARPNISVSRINPRHIAVNPDLNFRDKHGRGFLDDHGKPQAVEFQNDPGDRIIGSLTHRNAELERRLLIDFLDRNHKFRTGQLAVPHKVAAIAYPHTQFKADDIAHDLKDGGNFQGQTVYNNGSLYDWVRFLDTSAVLKGVTAHSSEWNSGFGDNYSASSLEVRTGGTPWRWKRVGSSTRFEPSFADQKGTADLYLHRTIWENNVLEDSDSAFFIHNGCQLNSPGHGASVHYAAPTYGAFQPAEGLLFYCKGLALAARSKVFNDFPKEFPKAINHSSAPFGEGLKAYYTSDSANEELGTDQHIASCKRAYFWSVIGDWTLKLKPLAVPSDSVSISWNHLSVREADGKGMIIMNGNRALLALPTVALAEKAVEIIRHYRFTSRHFVGRPDPSLQWWESDTGLPTQGVPGLHLEGINIHNLKIDRKYVIFGEYRVKSGSRILYTCPGGAEAHRIFYRLRQLRPRYKAWIGSGDRRLEFLVA